MKSLITVIMLSALIQPSHAKEMDPTIKLVGVLTVLSALCPLAINQDKAIAAVLAVHNGPPPPGYQAMAHRAAVSYLGMSKAEQFETCELALVEAEKLGIAR